MRARYATGVRVNRLWKAHAFCSSRFESPRTPEEYRARIRRHECAEQIEACRNAAPWIEECAAAVNTW